jgi:phosphoribosylformylglycinamidine synthase
MIHFFETKAKQFLQYKRKAKFQLKTFPKLNWLLPTQIKLKIRVDGFFGPRAAMVTPWSTNAVEITQNMAISGIIRIEEFHIQLILRF